MIIVMRTIFLWGQKLTHLMPVDHIFAPSQTYYAPACMVNFLGITLGVAKHIVPYQLVSQEADSCWGQLAHLIKLQSFIMKENRTKKVT